MSKYYKFAKLSYMHIYNKLKVLNECRLIIDYIQRLPMSVAWACYICFMLVLTPSTSFACDDNEQCIEQDAWSIGVAFGLGAKTNPLVDGDPIPQVIMFDIAWYGENAYFDNAELGYRWLDDDNFSVESYITLDRERAFFNFWDPANILINIGLGVDSPVLTPVPDPDSEPVEVDDVSIDDIERRKWAILGGTRFSYYQGSQKWSLSLETDISGVHSGHRLGLSYQKSWVGDKWRFQIKPSISWKSDALIDYYYGLDEADAAGTLYQGKGGFQPSISLFYAYEITPKWQLLFNSSYQSLHSGMIRSPIVNKKYVGSVFIGAGYRF